MSEFHDTFEQLKRLRPEVPDHTEYELLVGPINQLAFRCLEAWVLREPSLADTGEINDESVFDSFITVLERRWDAPNQAKHAALGSMAVLFMDINNQEDTSNALYVQSIIEAKYCGDLRFPVSTKTTAERTSALQRIKNGDGSILARTSLRGFAPVVGSAREIRRDRRRA